MSAFLKTLPQTVIGLVLVAAYTVFGYTGHLNSADTYTALMASIGLVGATGIYILASQFSNMNALPHLIVGVGIVGSVIALGVHGIFNSSQIIAVLGLLFTGTAGSTGALVTTTAPAAPPTSPAMPKKTA